MVLLVAAFRIKDQTCQRPFSRTVAFGPVTLITRHKTGWVAREIGRVHDFSPVSGNASVALRALYSSSKIMICKRKITSLTQAHTVITFYYSRMATSVS